MVTAPTDLRMIENSGYAAILNTSKQNKVGLESYCLFILFVSSEPQDLKQTFHPSLPYHALVLKLFCFIFMIKSL